MFKTFNQHFPLNDTPCNIYEGATGEISFTGSQNVILQFRNPVDSDVDLSIRAFVFTNISQTPIKIQFYTDSTVYGDFKKSPNIIQRNLNCPDQHKALLSSAISGKLISGRYVTSMVIPSYTSYNLDLHEHIVLPPSTGRTMVIESLSKSDNSIINIFMIWAENLRN